MELSWRLFAKGLLMLSLIRLFEWFPGLAFAIGDSTKIVPLWQSYNTWFEPGDFWLTNWSWVWLSIYISITIYSLFRTRWWNVLFVALIQFQLHLILFFYISTADNWRLICLWYAILAMAFKQPSWKIAIWKVWLVHLVMFYLLSVVHKLNYTEWRIGEALKMAAWHPFWGKDFPDWASTKMFTYLSYVIEFTFSICYLIPRLRVFGVLLALGFHFLLLLFLPVAGFSLVMMWCAIFVLMPHHKKRSLLSQINAMITKKAIPSE